MLVQWPHDSRKLLPISSGFYPCDWSGSVALFLPGHSGAESLLFAATTQPALRLATMSIMSFLCRLFPGRCEPPKAETAAPTTSADLGQTEAKNETLREEQLRHMEGGGPERPVQRTKPKKRL